MPFPTTFSKTTECFELVHVDIWGRYKYATRNGAYYYLSIVDDHSRVVWVYLMKNKYEASYFLTLFYMAKNSSTKMSNGYEWIMVQNSNHDTCFIFTKKMEYIWKHHVLILLNKWIC